jgi:hypothetical protein
VLERVEREHPQLALVLAAAACERLAIERCSAAGEKRSEAECDQRDRLLRRQPRSVLDGGDGAIREDVRDERRRLGDEGDGEPEGKVQVKLVRDPAPARDRGHHRERCHEEDCGRGGGQGERARTGRELGQAHA